MVLHNNSSVNTLKQAYHNPVLNYCSSFDGPLLQLWHRACRKPADRRLWCCTDTNNTSSPIRALLLIVHRKPWPLFLVGLAAVRSSHLVRIPVLFYYHQLDCFFFRSLHHLFGSGCGCWALRPGNAE